MKPEDIALNTPVPPFREVKIVDTTFAIPVSPSSLLKLLIDFINDIIPTKAVPVPNVPNFDITLSITVTNVLRPSNAPFIKSTLTLLVNNAFMFSFKVFHLPAILSR